MNKIIYIAGDGRSGSTLLELILSNDPCTISIGEAYRFWFRYYEGESTCGCSENISDCEFWDAIHKDLSTIKGYDPRLIWNQIQYLLKFKNRHRIKTILHQEEYKLLKTVVIRFYSKVYELANVTYIIDNSKSTGWLLILFELIPNELVIIHLERNLEAVANSWKSRVKLPEYSNKTVWMPRKSIWTSMKTWLKIKYTMRYFKKSINYNFLSYESFINNPNVFITEMMTKLNLSIDFNNLSYPYNHSIGGNPMRNNGNEILKISKTRNELNNFNNFQKIYLKLIRVISQKVL